MRIQGKSWKKHKGDVLLGLRTVDSEGKSYCGFQWPLRVGAWVEAPDWKPTKECGNGLHYLPWGQGNGHLLNWDADAIWLVIAVRRPYVNLNGKGKCKRCRIVHVGNQFSATKFLAKYAKEPEKVVGLCKQTSGDWSHVQTSGNWSYVQTSGDWSHVQSSGDWSSVQTIGDRSHAQTSGGWSCAQTRGHQSCAQTSGPRSHAQTNGAWSCAQTSGLRSHAQTNGDQSHAQASGDWSHAQASGKYGVAVSTNGGWASAGEEGCVLLARWSNGRMICKALHVGIDAKPGYWYKLDGNGKVIERKDPPEDWPWKE